MQNPFNESTIIHNNVPGNAANAQIIVTDMKGNLIRIFNASKGEGQVNINSGDLPAAIYNYTLLLNGEKIGTRQMVLAK